MSRCADETTSLTEKQGNDVPKHSKAFKDCLNTKYFGYFLGVIACSSSAFGDAFNKLLMTSITSVEIMCVRYICILSIYTCIFFCKRISVNLSKINHFKVIIASLFKACVPYMRCTALRHLTLLESATFVFTNLIYTGPISYLYLGIPMGIYDLVVIIISITGTVLACSIQSFFFDDTSQAVLYTKVFAMSLASLATFLSTINTYIIRNVQEAPVVYLMVLQTLFGSIIGIIALLVNPEHFVVPTEGVVYGWWVGTVWFLGIFSTLDTKCSKLIQTHEYAVLQTSELVASFLLQISIFLTLPTVVESIGLFMIMFAVIAYALKDKILEGLSGISRSLF